MAYPSNPEEIEEWLRSKFPKMKRKFRNPSLTTFNGIGPRFVGERDFDSETGSYVTTQYFCLLFIPIFAMGAYRVSSTGNGGWHILGKEPVSSLARKLNWIVLALLIAGSASFAWNEHISSPEYQVGKALEKAEAVRSSGAPDEAMSLYVEILTNSTFPRKDEARAGYATSFNEALEKLPLPRKQASIESALVARNLSPAPVGDLAERVLNYVGRAGAESPVTAAALLKTALPALQASDATAYRAAWRGYLEKAVSAEPVNANPAIDLAAILDAENKTDECRKLLEPHLDKLGKTEGARVLGQIYVREHECPAVTTTVVIGCNLAVSKG